MAKAPQHQLLMCQVQAAPHAVAERIRLFKYFLEHKVLIVAFLQCLQRHVQLLHIGRLRHVVQVFHGELPIVDDGYLMVLQKDDFVGIGYDGSSV